MKIESAMIPTTDLVVFKHNRLNLLIGNANNKNLLSHLYIYKIYLAIV